LSPIDLTVAASELAWDAILNSVPQVPAQPHEIQSVVKHELFKSYVGVYKFYGGGQLTISENNNELTAKFKGNGRIYFDENKEYRLKPATNGLFIIGAPSKDVIRFNQLNERSVATSMTINPGPWHIEAKRD
jgi:hypothetical protein